MYGSHVVPDTVAGAHTLAKLARGLHSLEKPFYDESCWPHSLAASAHFGADASLSNTHSLVFDFSGFGSFLQTALCSSKFSL